jgi:O-antigen ligase
MTYAQYQDAQQWSDELLLEGPPAEEAGALSTPAYILILGVAGVLAAVFGGFFWMIDLKWVAISIGGLVVGGLVVWRPEMGIFVMAALLPWEIHTRFTTSFTLVKAVGFLVAVASVVHVLGRRGPAWPMTLKLVLALALWGTLTSLWNFQSVLLLRRLFTFLSHVIFMYLVFRFCASRSALRTAAWIAAVSACGLALYSIVLLGGNVARLSGAEDQDQNLYGKLLFLGVFMPALLLSERRGMLRPLALVSIIVICFAGIILSVSRSSALGAVVGGIVMLFTLRKLSLLAKVGVLFAAAVVGLGAVYLAGQFGAGEAWAQRLSSDYLEQGVEARFGLARAALRIALSNPIAGVGIGQDVYAYGELGEWREAHNDVLTVFIQMGIPGGLLFLSAIILNWVYLWRLPPGPLRTGLLGLWTALLITGLFNPGISKKIYWFALGLGMAATAYSQRQRAAVSEYEPGEPTPPWPAATGAAGTAGGYT